MPCRIMYRVAEVTSEEEGHRGSELVEVGPQARGWMAAKYCIYPQTVIFGLESRTTVEKIQIMGHPWAVPTKVEIWIGDVPKGQEVDIKKAYFMKLGEVALESNKDNDYIARQLQSIEVRQSARPCPITFIKLVLHKNYQNRKNQYNQVGLTSVNIIGTPLEKAESQNGFSLDGDIWSLYDDLSFMMYTDTEVAQLINKLEKKKFEAVATERFEYAKKIKSAISELCEAGQMLGSLEMEKHLLADQQQYDEAKDKKTQMDEFRVEVYKTLEITDLLELQGLNVKNDRPMEICKDRIDQHFPIVQSNRLMLNQENKTLQAIPSPRISSPVPRISSHEPVVLQKSPTPILKSPSPAARTPSPVITTEDDKPTIDEELSMEKNESPQKVLKLKVAEKDLPQLTIGIDIFGEHLVAQCLSKNLIQKQAGIALLKTCVETFSRDTKIKPGKFFKGCSQVLVFLLKSSIWSVYQSACDITILLFERVAEQFSISNKTLSDSTKSIFSVILSRSGEPVQRIHDLSIETGIKVVKMPKLEELDVLDALITAKITTKEPPKVAMSRVKFTKFLVEEYGVSDEKDDLMCVKNLAKFGAGAVQHQDPDVRQAGQDLMIFLYKADQKVVRRALPEDNSNTRRSHTYKYVFEELDRYDKKLRRNREK